MSSTKKNGKKSSVSTTEPNSDLLLRLSHYSQETKHLEQAYAHLHKQFLELKAHLAASHQTQERIIAFMSDGLIFVTTEGTITLFNPAAAQLTGYPCEKVAEGLFWEFFPDSFFGFSMKEALERPKGNQRIFLTLGEETEVEVATSAIPEKGVLLLLCDRTEQRKLQTSLNQAERLQELGEMAATLAHEIRNPLGGIEGFAQLLKRDLEAPAHQRMIHMILEGTSALNQLVTNVLDFAKPLQLHFAPTDLVSVVKEAIAFLPKHAHACHFTSLHPSWIVSCDAGRIKLVLLNLLRNAFEAEAKRVEIVLNREGMLTIKDDGVGISRKNLGKIFTPFFTTKTKGTGLGLAEAMAVIKAHDGTLEVLSEEGKGTQFSMTVEKLCGSKKY